jgi:hypothetical protein
MGQNLKCVGPKQKIYEQRIIFKINIKGRIVLYAPYLCVRLGAVLHDDVHRDAHPVSKSDQLE